MNFFPIWERYFLREIFKIFTLFLFSFYLLYAIMDYSTHMQDFMKGNQRDLLQIPIYYAHQFLKRSNLLLSLALLLSTIKVLTTFNTHHELVAFQAAGMKLKKLLRPFFFVAALCTLFNYLNVEFFLPSSLAYVDAFHQKHFRHSHRGHRKEPLHTLHLSDGSKLVYQSYDAAKDSFFDVLWLRTSDEIWRIKFLKADPTHPEGKYIDRLKRNQEGLFERTQCFDSLLFKQLSWNPENSTLGPTPQENRALSKLYETAFRSPTSSSSEKAESATQFTFKAILSLLPLLVVIAMAPFCVRYSRGFPLFFLYVAGIFGALAFFTLMDAAVILGENQVLSPFWAIFFPFALCASAVSWKFAKTH